jgi:PadR family transcriptional regulator AphA
MTGARRGTELTGTSYALLGLLASRPTAWSAYELAQQMGRSLHYVWPRAERNLYDEVKLLADRGLARARQELVGRRPRTTYRITAAGRRALRAWLGGDSAPLTIESEALLRVFFAEHGTVDDLRRAVRTIREEAVCTEQEVAEMVRAYETDGGPFPDRLHVIALMGKLLNAHRQAMVRWADWAEEEVSTWTSTTLGEGATVPAGVFDEIIHTAESSSR